MAIQINYEDDIFLLQTMIKTLRAAVQLEVDADLFRDKIVEDALFIHTTIQKLFRGLYENPRLLRRMEYLRDVMRAKNNLIEALDSCLDEQSPLYVHLAAYSGKLRAYRNEQMTDVDDIRALLKRNGDEDETDDEDVVSQEEFLSLLKPDEDETETS